MSEVALYMDMILKAAEGIGVKAKEHLNTGLCDVKISEITAALPFKLPSGILDFYRWRNGMRLEGQPYEFRLIPRVVFEPLEEAVQRSNELISLAEDPAIRWRKTWYSLCTDLAGDYFAVEANGSPSAGTILAIRMASGPYPAFLSFRSMLSAFLDCYRVGAYLLDEDGFLVEDSRLSDIIYRVHNAGLSPLVLPDPDELRRGVQRARQIFIRENRNDLLDKLAELESGIILH